MAMWVDVKIMVTIRVILGLYWGYIGIMEKKMETTIMGSMGGCQNSGPFLGTRNIRCRIILGIQKGTIILRTTDVRMVKKSLSIEQWALANQAQGVVCAIPSGGGGIEAKSVAPLKHIKRPIVLASF